MSTYVGRLDSYHDHEYANEFEASVYLQHDMIMLKVTQHELNARVDSDDNRQYEEELKKKNFVHYHDIKLCFSIFTLNS